MSGKELLKFTLTSDIVQVNRLKFIENRRKIRIRLYGEKHIREVPNVHTTFT